MKKLNYKMIAKEVINLEISALQKLKKSLDKNFDKAVNAIVNCQSKIILCGVGKSGIIANKISATFSSIIFILSVSDNLNASSRIGVKVLVDK